jgi:DNA repair exonuclease SbcCD nuclease subunit
MKYALAADLHFHNWSAFADSTPEGLSTRLLGLVKELKRMAHENAERGAKFCVLAGDVFHVRGSVSPTVLNTVRDTLAVLVEDYHQEFIILAGNHDLEGKNSERLGSAITALEMEGVKVVNEPTLHGSTLLVPWFESVEELKAAIITAGDKYLTSEDDPDAGSVDRPCISDTDLILHAPIDGVIEGLPDHGLSPAWLASLGFHRVFSGHYHNHKEFPGRVYSIGALAHHSWSDVGSKAGFLLVDDFDVAWRKSRLPEFLDLDKLTEIDPAELPFLVDQNFVRVRLEAEHGSKVESLRSELMGMGAKGVLIQSVPTPPKREGGVVASVAAGASLEHSIGQFINAMPSTAELRSEVVKEAMSVLAAVDLGV